MSEEAIKVRFKNRDGTVLIPFVGQESTATEGSRMPLRSGGAYAALNGITQRIDVNAAAIDTLEAKVEGFEVTPPDGDYVIETRTLEDGTTYRKYKSGWVEIYGKKADGTSEAFTFTYPFELEVHNLVIPSGFEHIDSGYVTRSYGTYAVIDKTTYAESYYIYIEGRIK